MELFSFDLAKYSNHQNCSNIGEEETKEVVIFVSLGGQLCGLYN
jgi:hypothetical protein